jgi:PAS domain S-box-containing protein
VSPPEALSPNDLGIGRLFWTIREAVIVADAHAGRIVLWNPAAQALFGYTVEEALELPLDMLVPEPLRALHHEGLARFAATGHGRLVDQGTVLELPALRKGGHGIAIEMTLNPLEDLPRPGRYVLALVRDLTERRRTEAERLARARAEAARAESEAALQARNELVATIAHDLKSPLAAIKGLAQIAVRQTGPEGDAGAELLARIEGAATRMVRLLDDLQDTARLEAGQELSLARAPTDLVALARTVVAEQQRMTSQHRIQLASEEAPIVGRWDGPRLERVLGNLLGNAIKYSPGGGDILARLARDDGWAVLTVQDPGVGIPAADLPLVFERYRRGGNVDGHIAGAGIGLAGASQIVRQHGGTIEAASQGEGQGATFTVRIPLEPPQAGGVADRRGAPA